MTDLLAPPVAAPARPAALTRVRALVRSDAAVIGAVAVWFLVLAAAMWGTWGDLRMDTGYDLLAASRTAHGQLPYVDYVYWYGPLSPLLLGGLFALTGPAVWPAVGVGLVLAGAAVALTFALARIFVPAGFAGLAAALVAPIALSGANNSYVLPHAVSAPLAIVLVLAMLHVLARWSIAGATGRRAPALAGVLAALVALTRPELALATYAALGLWLGARVLNPTAGRRAALLDAAALLAPALALPAVVYGAFAAKVGLHELLFTNLYPRAFVAAAGHVILDAHAPKTPASIAKLGALTALYGAGLFALAACGAVLRAGGRPRKIVLWAAGLGAIGLLAVLARRPETVRYYLQYAYAWIPAGAWIVAGGLWWSRRQGSAGAAGEALLAVVVLLAVGTANTYASFLPFPNAEFPEATVYLLPVAAVFLAWVHGDLLSRRGAGVLGALVLALLAVCNAGLALHDARAETATVRGPHGALAAKPADAAVLQSALDVIGRETRPGDPVLLAPQLTALYTMSGRTDPLRELSLLPGSLATPADEDRAIARMQGVRLVLVNRRPLSLYEQGAFGTTFDRRLAAWIHRDFRRTATLGGPDALSLDVWLRRTP